jgi:hypothetical protein
MPLIQEPAPSFTTSQPRSARYYAAGALVHLGLAGAVAALGYDWSGVLLAAAAMLAVFAAWARYRKGAAASARRRNPPPPVIHAQARD